jgi:hypothetical protein
MDKEVEGKQFFFEKKNQKTFVLRTRAFETARTKEQKFFAELFYKKATSSL